MSKSIESLVSFSAGEWSPTLTARVDQQKYRAACLQLRNMLCLKTGPATRRPGTQYIGTGKRFPEDDDFAIRLQDFQFSINTAFIWEFGQNYLRFYSNGAQVTLSTAPLWVTATNYPAGSFTTSTVDGQIYYAFATINGGTTDPSADNAHWIQQSIYEVPTPYDATVGVDGLAATEVFQLQFCEINDVTYICHPNHPRYKLTRLGDTNWTFAPVQDLTPALLDQNATDIAISATQTSGTTLLIATAPAWSTGFYYDIGSSATVNGVIYNCIFPHVSGTFATDLANGDWEQAGVFLPGHVGSYWELAYLRDSAYVEYDGTAAGGFTAGTSSTITAFGDWEVHTYGVWSADIAVQSSSDGGITWQTVRTVSGRNDRNVDITGTAVDAQLYQLVISNVSAPPTAGPTNPRVVFECVDAFLYGIVQITVVTVVAASAMVNGDTYQIDTLGTTNWGALGAPVGFAVGTIFTYNGTSVTGSGGTCHEPYVATANVITQLTVADEWISGFAYSVNDRVGYNGVNYICINSPLTNPTTSPDMDPTDWLADGYPTIYWSEGAWSAVRGYPSSITAFEQRVWCGFTEYEPQRIWGTQTDDIENWDLGDQTLATDGVAFDLDAVGDGGIVWMQSQDSLFVGMVSAEWVISASDGTSSIGPTNIAAHRQSKWGSNANIPARVVGDALVFVQRQAFSMRQMLYSVVTNKYMSQDLTALSDQVLNLGALQTAYQKQGQKNGFVWATTTNGELVGLTYELDQEIFGWHRHITGVQTDFNDSFESVAVIQGQGTNDDEVWVVVNRSLGADQVPTRYIERLNPINWQADPTVPESTVGYPANKNTAFYVDSGATFVSPGSNIFNTLTWLEARTVAVCVNGVNYDNFTVTGGTITVTNYDPEPGDIVQIGLPFTSTLQPQNLDVDVHTGVTQGIIKKVTGLTLALYNTLTCTVGDGKRSQVLSFIPTSDPLTPPPLFSGIKEVKTFQGDYGFTIPVIISTSDPLPLTVLGVAVAYNPAGTP